MKRSRRNTPILLPTDLNATSIVEVTGKPKTDIKNKKSHEKVSSQSPKDASKRKETHKRRRSSGTIEPTNEGSLPIITEAFVVEEELEEEQTETNSINVEELLWDRIIHPRQLKMKKYPSKLGVGGRDSCMDICNRKCIDSRIGLPPIKRSDSAEMYWNIRGICEPQPIETKPVLAVQRVTLRRKEKHEEIIMQLTLRMNDVNEAIEQEIRKQANNVVSHINLIKENVDNILDIVEEKQGVGLSINVVNRMQAIMKQLNDNRLSKIDTFCDYVRKLEMQRSENFKHILRKVYKDMHDTMFLLPYEIQKFFEKKLQHINQITMNNYHCFTELEGKLKQQMEEEMKTWFQKLKVYEKVEKSISEEQEGAEPKMELAVIVSNATLERKREMASKLDETEKNFQKLIEVASNSIYLRSHHILEVYRNYLAELLKVATSIVQAGLLDQVKTRGDYDSIYELSIRYDIDEEEIQNIRNTGLQELLKSLDSNLKSFIHSTRVFDNYVGRLEDMKHVYTQLLYLYMTKHDKALRRINNNINILLDKLRQESTQDNLNKTFTEIVSTISSIDTIMLSNLKEKNALVDKFALMSLANGDLLNEEIRRFVKQFVPPPDSDPRVMRKRASWMNADEIKNDDHLFTNNFLNCRYMVNGIDNWQFGVWQALITIMETSKQALLNIATSCSSVEKNKLKSRYELKIKMNNIRIHSIREDFWKVRMVELKTHQDRLIQHRLGIEENMGKLINLRKEMESLCSNYLGTKYNIELSNAMVALNKVVKKRHLWAIKQNVRYINMMALQELKPEYERISNAHFGILMDMRNSHLKFLKSIRFFSEDGNFAAGEMKYLTKQMNALEHKLSKELIKNKDSIMKIYGEFQEVCREKTGVHFHTLDKYLDEYSFKEEIEMKIKELNGNIGEGICEITFDVKKLEGNIRSLKNASYYKENLGCLEWLPTFLRCFQDIKDEIQLLLDKLAYFEWIPSDDRFLRRRTLQSPLSSMMSAKSSKSGDVLKLPPVAQESKNKKLDKRSTYKYTPLAKSRNYVSILYPTNPQGLEPFFAKLHSKIFTSFCDLQETAKAFYEKHEDVLNRGLVIPEYKLFIEELLATYKYHQLQLEFVWLECIAQFTKMVTNFQEYLDDYYKDFMMKYFEGRKTELNQINAETIKNLEENCKSIEEYYMTAHRKLKVMFGHPDLWHMLTPIEQYIDDAENYAKKTLLKNLVPSKETLNKHCLKTESIFLEMENLLSNVIENNSIITLKVDLETQLLEKTERIMKILALVDNSDIEVDESHVLQNVVKKLRAYKKKSQIPPEVIISYTSIIESHTASEASIKFLNTETLIKENYADYEICAEKIEGFKRKCQSIHKKYKIMWKQDVDKIMKLYQVKYDCPTIE